MTEWITVKIPIDMANQADALIGKHGYKSRSDVVVDALRDFMDKRKEA